MIRAALLALCLVPALAPGATAVGAPSHGLIENRTGLPLTLPLQIRTAPGRDAYLVLRNAGSGAVAVTAYVEGGRFFRLLMPPGSYTLHAALGREWQGPEALFGPATQIYDHPDALRFAVEGLGRKTGHLIDLRGLDRAAGIAAETLALCQVVLSPPHRPAPGRGDGEDPAGARSVAPEVTFDYPLPPGPRDHARDGRPDLGREFGNHVAGIPLAQRLGEGRAPLHLPQPAPVPDRIRVVERPCD